MRQCALLSHSSQGWAGDQRIAQRANDLRTLPAKRRAWRLFSQRELRDIVARHERGHVGKHVEGVGEDGQGAGEDAKHHLCRKVREGENEHEEKLLGRLFRSNFI